ncbi:MAG: 3-ketoacyl-ACP reductase [Chthonomonadales bacterium]|nr:3-ketoacyl-ACP reductase [Chthonomonadales bacterium]
MRKVALITGGTRGIGLGIARSLAGEGLTLALNGLRPAEAVQEPLESLRGRGIDVEYFQADISVADDRNRLVRDVLDTFGRINVLVNNAGVAPTVRADILEASEESYERLMATNLKGPFFLTQAVARVMIDLPPDERRGRSIVFVTSVSASVASVNRGDYCMAKAGLSMAARLWAVRLAEHGIPVYEIRPGIIETDMTASVRDRYDRLIADGLLLESRWGRPEDVGRAVAALVRGDVPYATGAVLTLDGGLTVDRL